MADDAGYCFEESAGKKCLKGKLRFTDPGNYAHSNPPDNPSGQHGTDEGKINIGDGFREFFV